jgi:ribosomal protein S18 acetylase RimI-like enzyme
VSGDLSIREGVIGDAEIIAKFNSALARETEAMTLDAETLARGVRRALADERLAKYFVAEREGKIVGQLMITREWSDWRDGEIWWIQSVYVSSEARGAGVFAKLYAHAKVVAQRGGAVGLRLYVEKENERAQKSYLRAGMHVGRYLVMEEMF